MLGDERWLAWYAQAKMNSRLLELMTAEQERRTGLPAAWFDVLAHLCPKDRGQVRMNELADELVVSRGGATRIIGRMEEEGLVARETPADDRRATYAVVTDKGRAAFEAALPVHLELVEEGFGRYLEPGDVEALLSIAARISAAYGWPVKTPAENP
jgi:DNA-binding MarR family transcriptional regulator